MNIEETPPGNPSIYGLFVAAFLLLAIMEKLREAMQFRDSPISFAHLTVLAAILTFLWTVLLIFFVQL
jgi:hypothetical protein